MKSKKLTLLTRAVISASTLTIVCLALTGFKAARFNVECSDLTTDLEDPLNHPAQVYTIPTPPGGDANCPNPITQPYQIWYQGWTLYYDPSLVVYWHQDFDYFQHCSNKSNGNSKDFHTPTCD